MKTLKLLLGFMFLLLIACAERPKGVSNGTVSTDSTSNELLVLSVQAHEGALISLLLEAKNAKVDWGDGSMEQTEFGTMEHELFHRYSVAGEYKIRIYAKNISVFIIDNCINIRAGLELSCKGCESLKTLYCSAAKLQKLDVRECPSLTVLVCHTNSLQSLDVSKNMNLTYLDCSNNDMRKLNVTGCARLRQLLCNNNKIEELSMEKNKMLDFLDCSDNRLRSLNLFLNKAIYAVNCANNCMDALALNTLFASLPEAKYIGDYCRIYVKGNDGAKLCNFTIANKKDWVIAQWWW